VTIDTSEFMRALLKKKESKKSGEHGAEEVKAGDDVANPH